MTVSIGVAEFPANGITRDDIVRAADAALYQAKEAGRNRVCLASSYGSARRPATAPAGGLTARILGSLTLCQEVTS